MIKLRKKYIFILTLFIPIIVALIGFFVNSQNHFLMALYLFTISGLVFICIPYFILICYLIYVALYKSEQETIDVAKLSPLIVSLWGPVFSAFFVLFVSEQNLGFFKAIISVVIMSLFISISILIVGYFYVLLALVFMKLFKKLEW